ncbi:glutathione S-transferase family protein [Roseibium algae]|uniref:Glutathione S-transferase family protein n=1 Tax=Roseibium algae TaxID=3123038 RepID=A0ABU8TT57_9HYPH
MHDKITFYYAPQTRALSTAILLDELNAPYELHVLNMKVQENRQPEFLALNPLGKVPAILHGDTLVTEQVAIQLYLGDLFPNAGITPAIADPRRGSYLRWMVIYAACFEPALVDAFMKREPVDETMSPYGTHEQVIDLIRAQLSTGPYLLGDRFTVADVLWATALMWTMQFGIAPKLQEFTDYTARVFERPCFKQALEKDASMAAEHEAAAAG